MSRKIAFCGIFTALATACLYMASVLPTNKIFCTGLATLFVPLTLVIYGKRWAFAILAASAALAFMLLPDKLICAGFLVLGFYTVLKSYIERIWNLVYEWALKIAVYFAAAFTALSVFNIEIKELRIAVLLVGALIFVVYDIVLSMGITYLSEKIKNIVKNH